MNKEVTYLPEEKIKEAAETYETPFFLYEEKKIRENCQRLKKSFGKYFDNFWPLYAVKANPNPDIIKIILDEGFGLDCSSPSEVWIGSKLTDEEPMGMFTGNYNTKEELKMAKESGMIVNLDGMYLIPRLEEIGVPDTISFRVNPGIGKAGLKSNILAGPDAKFGMSHEKAPKAYQKMKSLGVKTFGIHMMTGSNVRDEDYFFEIVEKLFEIIANIKSETGIEIEIMNIGGGFGVPYKPEDKSLDLEKVAEGVREVFDIQCKKHNLKEPRLLIEPGRYVAANAGWLVSKAIAKKDSYKKFVGVDAGSNDMPRPATYGAYHHASVINDEKDKEKISIVGRLCENNDQLARDRKLPKIEKGDLVVIHNCGAHAYSMGHNYNGRPRSAEYLSKENGDIEKIRDGETIKDLFRLTKFIKS